MFETLQNLITVGQKDWGSIHPIIVHLPIVSLLIAPFFILFGLISQNCKRTLYYSSLGLMLIGTLGILLSISSGELASSLVNINDPALIDTLAIHEELAEKIQTIFSVLTGFFFCYVVFLPLLKKKLKSNLLLIITIIYLVAYFYSLGFLIKTAHYGAKLVHHHGVHSNLFNQ